MVQVSTINGWRPGRVAHSPLVYSELSQYLAPKHFVAGAFSLVRFVR